MNKHQTSGYWRFFAILLSGGFTCLLLFLAYGSTLDENGFLHEAFALLPIGYLLLFVGAIGSLFMVIIKLYWSIKVK